MMAEMPATYRMLVERKTPTNTSRLIRLGINTDQIALVSSLEPSVRLVVLSFQGWPLLAVAARFIV